MLIFGKVRQVLQNISVLLTELDQFVTGKFWEYGYGEGCQVIDGKNFSTSGDDVEHEAQRALLYGWQMLTA